ncbi:MAG: 3-isopropylmalate dehydrogenase, partial [Magnetococcales bacterium]|nr:3-isopropylmalate dehydrogenase [Magnetococcales bacterium]
MAWTILLLPGDGIGPEIVNEARKVLEWLKSHHNLTIHLEEGLIGGAAYDATGTPLPDETLQRAKAVDGILLGAVGGPKW